MSRHLPRRRRHDERGDVIVGWLTRLVVLLALGGTVAFDTASVGAAHVTAPEDATEAARAGADAWETRHRVDDAYVAAVETVDARHTRLPPEQFLVTASGEVTLVLESSASTLLLRHIGPLTSYSLVQAEGSARPQR